MDTEPAKITVPLNKHSGGTLRVGGTRVSLDTVVGAFREGSIAEEIAQRYPALDLADVYSVIAYYLTHRKEVADYMHTRRLRAAKLREEIEAEHPTAGIRERLLARRRDVSHD